jgi:microcompartment protein CcmL/EutN
MADETYGIAPGMIETRGLVPTIEATDAMNTGAVNAAVRAGDGLVTAHIIARPHHKVEPGLSKKQGVSKLLIPTTEI